MVFGPSVSAFTNAFQVAMLRSVLGLYRFPKVYRPVGFVPLGGRTAGCGSNPICAITTFSMGDAAAGAVSAGGVVAGFVALSAAASLAMLRTRASTGPESS